MPSIRIPTPLRTYTQGQSEVDVQGSSVAEALSDLVSQYPSIKPHLFNGSDALRPFVNLFLNARDAMPASVTAVPSRVTPRRPSRAFRWGRAGEHSARSLTAVFQKTIAMGRSSRSTSVLSRAMEIS